MNTKKIDQIFARLAARDPEPKIELNFTNEFTLLVAVVLSAQATDKGVNKATPALFAVADTPQKMLTLGVAGVTRYIKTIGLYKGKAKNIIGLSRMSGVGSKTAHVWLNCALGQPLIAVDTHVFRVANRLGLCKTTSAGATEKILNKIIPDQWKMHAHHWLILHGRYVCVARKPKCPQCVIRDLCEWPKKILE